MLHIHKSMIEYYVHNALLYLPFKQHLAHRKI